MRDTRIICLGMYIFTRQTETGKVKVLGTLSGASPLPTQRTSGTPCYIIPEILTKESGIHF